MDCVCVYVLVTFIHYFCCCFFLQQKHNNRSDNENNNNNKKTERIILLLTTIAIYNKKMHTHTKYSYHMLITLIHDYIIAQIFFFLSLFNNVHHLWKWYAVPSMPLTHNVCLHSVICVCRQNRGRKRNRVREKGGERKIERNAVGRTELKVVF